MNDEAIWLTPAAQRKLQEDLEYLTTDGRRELEQRIAEARDHGDLRENAEYDAAKNDQGLMEAKIRRLKHILDTAEIRQVENSGAVEIGTLVTVIDEDEDEWEYLVAPKENRAPGMLLASLVSCMMVRARSIPDALPLVATKWRARARALQGFPTSAARARSIHRYSSSGSLRPRAS